MSAGAEGARTAAECIRAASSECTCTASKSARIASEDARAAAEDIHMIAAGACKTAECPGQTSYAVFPGITVRCEEASSHDPFSDSVSEGERLFVIRHCREGRMECHYKNQYAYLSQGELAICGGQKQQHATFLPLGEYRGCAVIIDLDKAPESLSSCLEGVDVCPGDVLAKFCTDRPCCLLRKETGAERIFSEIYGAEENNKKGYLQLKVLELLLHLDGCGAEASQAGLSASQVEIAKSACQYLTQRMESKVTLEELCMTLHVSGTHLKNCFKGVYGISIYAYIRSQKMQAAADTLLTTDSTVLEVAGQYGYDNGSKFAKAFRDVIGMTPREYRRRSRMLPKQSAGFI